MKLQTEASEERGRRKALAITIVMMVAYIVIIVLAKPEILDCFHR